MRTRRLATMGTAAVLVAAALPNSLMSMHTAAASGCTIVKVAAGDSGAAAILSDGTVVTWGALAQSDTPVPVSGLSNVTQLVGAGGNFYALESDGTVWAWGSDANGELGDGRSGVAGVLNTATQVPGLSGIIQIAAGNDHALALTSQGTVWAWGQDYNGQLGDGNGGYQQNVLVFSATPTQVRDAAGTGYLQHVVWIGSGPLATHSLAVTDDFSVWAWGSNWYGQLGDGTSHTERYLPFRVPPPSGGFPSPILPVTATQGSSTGLASDGSVWSWGGNFEGEFGNGGNADSFAPVKGLAAGIQAVTGGGGQVLATDSGGTLWAWGWNVVGELGVGTTQNAYSPVQVKGPGGVGILSGVTSFAAGRHFSLAVNPAGAWAWGDNTYGQLGNGSKTGSLLPTPISCGASAPTTLGVTLLTPPTVSVTGWTYAPPAFSLIATVKNTGASTATGLQLTISFPAGSGLSLASGAPTLTLSDLLPGNSTSPSWLVKTASQYADSDLTYAVTVTSTNAPSVSASQTVHIPSVRPRYVAFGDSITTGFSDPTCNNSFDLSGTTGTPWGCPRQAPPATPYPDLVANRLGYTYSDSVNPYLATVPQPGFPNLDLARVGIWGSAAVDAANYQGGYPSSWNAPWLPQLQAIAQAQELVTGGLGINDLGFDDHKTWLPIYWNGGTKAVDARVRTILHDRRAAFDLLFSTLDQAKANGAKIVIVLYYNPVRVVLACQFARNFAAVLIDDLNAELRARAIQHNFLIADPQASFDGPPGLLAHGHGLGAPDSERWVFGTRCDFTLGALGILPDWVPVIPHDQNFFGQVLDPHPNSAGAQAIAQTVWTALGK